MRLHVLSARIAATALAAFVVACSSGTPGTVEPDGGTAIPGADGSTPGTPSDPTGACGGLVACGAACTTLDEDAAHCGDCATACPSGSACLAGTCKPTSCEDDPISSRVTCGSFCVNVRDNPDHCGACGVRCGSKQACYDAACVDTFGAGDSCADPIVMPGGGDNVQVAFTFGAALQTQVLTCGDPAARPRKVFRFTANANKPNSKFSITGGLSSSDLVLELFGDASCGAASAIGCNDDGADKRPTLETATASGKTYFVVVSSKGAPPAGRFYLKFDD